MMEIIYPQKNIHNKSNAPTVDRRSAKEMANYFNVSKATITRWTQLDNDPLPMKKVLGTLVFEFEDVLAWEKRNTISNYEVRDVE